MSTRNYTKIYNPSTGVEDTPKSRAHFFYTSPVAIDDPLSILPVPGSFEASWTKQSPRPFSDYDNRALEKAWRACFSEATRKDGPANGAKDTGPISSLPKEESSPGKAELRTDFLLAPEMSYEGQFDEQRMTKDYGKIVTGNDAGSTERDAISLGAIPCEENLCSTPGEASLQQMRQTASDSKETELDSVVTINPNPVQPSLSSLDSDKRQFDSCTQSTPRNDRETTIDIPVGLSKLYSVKLPAMQMMPIYWSAINDVATVTRGTWFYKDSMYPVEFEVATQLETGYIKHRPWRQEWCDRLSKAIEDGASGDQDFRFQLRLEEGVQGQETADRPARSTPYLGSVVCYNDSTNAFILRPGIEQSQYFRLRSLSKIAGGSVGIPVVRGFDPEAWEHLHPSKKPASPGYFRESLPPTADIQTIPTDTERPEVTDLIFVVHGIGQKLTQRYEGFSFTHATNSLRQLINTDLLNPLVQKGLRNNFGGIAVLPINWRSRFSLGDGEAVLTGQNLRPSKASTSHRHLGLVDITPHTIPAVRGLISDVLLDIPFYMSSHKAQMLEAVIEEANRIYRLWCHNNPGFQKRGRVHIIGHSLGSALCLDILSRQPTFVTPFDEDDKIQTKNFEFDTSNLFFIGSPVGFFLLLGGGKLIPRSGRTKPSIGLDDEHSEGVTGKEGTYGCMAVDNLYNVMHYNDPIAYRVNAAVDVVHTTLLKAAEVPSAAKSWWDTLSVAAQNIKQGVSALPFAGGKANNDPISASISQSNSTGQDLSIAGKKFLLLNDNGQIDYFLKAAEGPDIQYLNMLWAHSSYWNNLDFVRLLVTEIGREPGGGNALAAMKAVMVPSPESPSTTE